MEKLDFNRFLQKYQPFIQKTSHKLRKAIKTAEEDLSRVYEVAETHVEIQLKNLEKEKLYHALGKYVAAELLKGSINIPELEKYKRSLEKISAEGDKMKNKLSHISKFQSKKSSK